MDNLDISKCSVYYVLISSYEVFISQPFLNPYFAAKEVLKRKFLVGLLDNKRGSFARFDHYFKWKESPKYTSEFGCRKQLMDEKYVPKHPVRKGSDTWNLLMEQNRFDIHLYDYAKELFVQQSFIFGL